MFIDSDRVKKSEIMKYDANDIASVTILNDTTAYRMFGDNAKDGALYIETKPFAESVLCDFLEKFLNNMTAFTGVQIPTVPFNTF